jgi:hypothetical protein
MMNEVILGLELKFRRFGICHMPIEGFESKDLATPKPSRRWKSGD